MLSFTQHTSCPPAAAIWAPFTPSRDLISPRLLPTLAAAFLTLLYSPITLKSTSSNLHAQIYNLTSLISIHHGAIFHTTNLLSARCCYLGILYPLFHLPHQHLTHLSSLTSTDLTHIQSFLTPVTSPPGFSERVVVPLR
eukprot:GHVN01048942.1.p1 GENE.GHVN01048942.1~~GHVN01048942.1.p1  ORF type:complete len:139 (-),score=27.62 GHVN01048942.1:100-516(-)